MTNIMQIIKKTKKYLHVRMTQEEYDLLEESLTEEIKSKEEEANLVEYAKWFYTNHVEIEWEDEYSSYHTDWRDIHTGDHVMAPGFEVSMYRPRFTEVIRKNKKLYQDKKW